MANDVKAQSEVSAFAPATVANVACAFDVLGFAIDSPGDTVTARRSKTPGVVISSIRSEYGDLPFDPLKNTASVAVTAMMNDLSDNTTGIELDICKGMPIGSGLGSSAASAAAALFAAATLLNAPYAKTDLVRFAVQGEFVACGSGHADNVAPSLLGGFALIRSYSPLDIIKITPPKGLWVAVVHPAIEVRTSDARKVLKKLIPLSTAVEQFGNIAGLVAGLCTENIPLVARSLNDAIIEPERSLLIPGFDSIKKSALQHGALGCSISGAGPSLFALCPDEQTASAVGNAMQRGFLDQHIAAITYLSQINNEGAKVVHEV